MPHRPTPTSRHQLGVLPTLLPPLADDRACARNAPKGPAGWGIMDLLALPFCQTAATAPNPHRAGRRERGARGQWAGRLLGPIPRARLSGGGPTGVTA